MISPPPAILEPEEDVAEGDLAELLSLKEGTTFVVADSWGDIRGGASGLFGDGTRLLSRLRLFIGDKRPSRLNHGLSRDSAVFTFNGANLALPPVGGRTIPRGVIHLERKRCLDRWAAARALEAHELRSRFGDDPCLLRVPRRLSRHLRSSGHAPRPSWRAGGAPIEWSRRGVRLCRTG